MVAGFEARAKLSVDVSQFVTASREATQTVEDLNVAVRAASRAIRSLERAGRTAGDTLKTFQSSVRDTASGARDVANAQQQMGRGVRENAQAFTTANTSAQQYSATQLTTARSLRQFAREIVDTDERVSQLRRSMELGRNTNGQLNQSYTTLQQHLRGLRQQYEGLDQGTRASVRAQMDLLTAQRSATTASREADQAVRQLNRARLEEVRAVSQSERVNQSAARSMARSLDQVRQQHAALAAVRQQNGRLDAQQQQAMRTIAQRARELRQEYQNLSGAQRAAVQSIRALNAASDTASASMRELAATGPTVRAGMTQASVGVRSIDESLWSLRASVGEIEGMLRSLQQTSMQVTRSLWENYSGQEMAIAQISRVSQVTAMELDSIVASVRQMSREIPLAFNELAEITKLGSQVGVADSALVDFTETVALFSATSEVTADETATLLARISQMANVPDDEIMNLGSAVAFLGSNSAATDREILTTVESIATVGNQAGMSETAIVGLGGAMASLRIRPELARGAMQRVFNHLEVSVRGSGSAMEQMTQVTGQSQDALIGLLDSGEHTDEFFWTIIRSLSEMHDQGQNLIPVLREMGIINTRDVDVMARLAANWDVLQDSVTDATSAYAEAGYLYAESDKIFNTLTASVQLMSNAWQEFLYEAVVAIAPFVSKVVEGTTALIQFAQASGVAPWVGLSAILLALAAAIGTLGIAVTTVTRGWVAWRGVLLATRGLYATNTASTVANTAALVGNAAAANTNTAAKTAAALANTRLATSSGAATVATVAQTSALGGATAAMRAFAMAHPITFVAGLTAAIAAATASYNWFSDSAGRAERALLRSNDAHINAAGGANTLRQALQTDTQVWREAQEQIYENIDALGNSTSAYSTQAEEIRRASRFRVQAVGEMSEADAEAARQAEVLGENQKTLSDQLANTKGEAQDTAPAMGDLAEGVRDAAQAGVSADNSIGQLNGSLKSSTEAAHDNVFAIGLATRQWAAASLESSLLESGLLANEEAFKMVQEAGTDFGRALTLEMDEAGAGVEYLQGSFQEFYDSLTIGEKIWGNVSQSLFDVSGGFVDLRSDVAIAGQAIWDASENLEATTLTIEEATRAGQELDGMFVMLPNGVRASQEELAAFAEEGGEAAAAAMLMDEEISGLGISVSTLTEAFTGFMDPLSAWDLALQTANAGIDAQNEALREANQELDNNDLALASQYESLLEVSGGFGLYLDELEKMSQSQMEWSQNLMKIADEVPPHVLAGLTEMGVDGAEIVAGLVNASDEEVARFVELWDQGAGDVSDTFSVMFSDFLTQAAQSGDTAGVDFVMGLMDQVAAGDISFREAVNEMTAYAEDEFQNADTENEPNLELTEVLRDLTNLIEKIETDTQNAKAETTPTLRTTGFWDSLRSFWDDIVDWWGSGPQLGASFNASTGAGGRYGSQGRKDGGWVAGPGGPRDDRIPMMLSDKEFVVNARSAREFGPLLEYINSQRGQGGKQIMTPNFVPDDILTMPRRPLNAMRESTPDSISRSMNTVRRTQQGGWNITVNNQYPQAEPTSVTVNRALAYTAALDGVD